MTQAVCREIRQAQKIFTPFLIRSENQKNLPKKSVNKDIEIRRVPYNFMYLYVILFLLMEKTKKCIKPFLIGLTGQSCAGKNEAAFILQKHGFFCIDADTISRDIFFNYEKKIFSLFQSDAEKKKIRIDCGAEKEKKIDKKNFALLVFSDPLLLKKHEDFLLPKIETEINKRIDAAFAENPMRPILLNAPILHKTSLIKKCKLILYIKAPLLIRIKRAKKRDGLPLKNILARFSKQKRFFSQYFFLNADIVVVKNFGSIAKLEKKLLQKLTEKGF